jgi:hypothetical protein
MEEEVSLVDIHARLGNTAMYYAIIMAVWGLWRFARKQGIDSSYWGALVIAEVLFLVQGAIGVFMWLSQSISVGIHLLYGVVAVLVIPAVYAYTRGDEQRRAALIYGIALLFLVGIVIRAIATAP